MRVTILMLLFMPLWCTAGKPYRPEFADPMLEPWRWREVEELSGMGALCVDEAPDGTFWFGNAGSIAHYDGLNVKKIAFGDELLAEIMPTTLQPITYAIRVTRDGHLLMVIGRSLVARIGDEWTVINKDVGGTGFAVRLEQAHDGSIWLMSRDKVLHLSEDFQTVQTVVQTTAKEKLTAFCLDDTGDAWVFRITSNGTGQLIHIAVKDERPVAESEWKIHRLKSEAPHQDAALVAGEDGAIWYVDNSGNGTYTFDPVEQSWRGVNHPDAQRRYSFLMRDQRGTLWAGGTGRLCSIGRQFRYYESDQLNLPSVPLSIYETSGGQWWVIGRVGHVYWLDCSQTRWRTYENLHFQCSGDDGVDWYITNHRDVVSHDTADGTWLLYDKSDGLISYATSVMVSSQGLVWAAGGHNGRAAIGVLRNGQWERLDHPDFAYAVGQRSIFEAADGTMWVGAEGDLPSTEDAGGGLNFGVSDETGVHLIKHYRFPELPLRIRCFAQTPDGTIWVGSPTIHCIDLQSNLVWQADDLPKTGTDDLVLDRDQNLWVLKAGFGIFQQQGKAWRRHTREDGLSSEAVVDLLAMQDGSILAATDRGVCRFDGQAWMTKCFPDSFSMSPVNGSLRQSGDGALWFNFTENDRRSPWEKLNNQQRFCTVRYMADAHPPEASIEGYLKKVAPPGNVHITWSGQDYLNGTAADQLQYAWRLDGGAWSPFSYETGRTFLGLDSGLHTLEVRARDRDFNVDPTPASCTFAVALPVWRQWWFLVMSLSLVFGATAFIMMMIWFHDKRLKDRAVHAEEIDRMKTGFFTNISHELRTPLTLISEPLEDLLETEQNDERREMLGMALRNAGRVRTLATQLLDFRRLEQGKLSVEWVEGSIRRQVEESLELLQRLSKTNRVAMQFQCERELRGWYDPDKLRKILQNLVNNAIKYTPAGGTVRIQLREATSKDGVRKLELTVEDTGPGIDPVHLSHIFERFYRIPEKSIVDGSGIGLNLTKELVKLMGGTIDVVSPVFEDPLPPGTRFTVQLPIHKPRDRDDD